MKQYEIPETGDVFTSLIQTEGTANNDGFIPICLMDKTIIGIRFITTNSYEVTMDIYNCVLDYNDIKKVIAGHGGINNFNTTLLSI